MRKFLFYAVITIICSCGCSGNSFYVDIQNQSLVRCNGRGMLTVSIYLSEKMFNRISSNPIDSRDFYLIKYTRRGNNNDNNIYLMKFNENYDIFFNDTLVTNGVISLKPETEYNVVHISDGDATPSSILIETDKNGMIVKAERTDCD